MNILIVDDKPNLARVTSVALRTLGCNSSTADNVTSANHLLKAEKFDAVFLDLNLNGENGFLFLSELVSRALSVPIILFTAHPKEEVAAEAKSRGAFDCLIKPYTLDDLRRQIARIEQYHKLVPGNSV